MTAPLTDTVALITGSSSGIGAALPETGGPARDIPGCDRSPRERTWKSGPTRTGLHDEWTV